MNNKTVSSAFLFILILIVVSTNILWLKADNTPQRWDESIHLMAASGFAEAVKIGPAAALKAFLAQESYYPPLVPFVGAFFGLKDREEDNFTFSMSLWTAMLIIFTFLYAHRRFGNPAAFAASALAAAYPIFCSEGHYFMFDLPLSACFIASMYFMEKTELLQKRGYSAVLGIICGLSMLVKWTFLIYAAAPLIFLTGASFAGPQDRKKAAQNLVILMVLFAAVAAPWYLYNGVSIVLNVFKYAYERGATENQPAVLSPAGLIFYFTSMPPEMTWLFFSLFLAGAVLLAASPKKRKELWFFIIPVVIFTLLRNKKDRYIMPVLPLAAVISSYAICALGRARLRTAAACAVVAAAVLNFIFLSGPLPFHWPSEARPSQGDWHIKDFLSKLSPGASLAIVPDAPYMNNIGYSFYARNFFSGVRTIGIFNFPMFADYFLVKTGDMGPVFSGADRRAQILAQALDPKSEISGLYEKIYSAQLPDGSTGMLYMMRPKPRADLAGFEDGVSGNIMELLSNYLKNTEHFSFRISYDGFTVKQMNVSFRRGIAGDFRHKDRGLAVQDADIAVNKIAVNPYAVKGGKLQLISMGSVEIRSMKVSAADFKDFAALYVKKMSDLDVTFEKGLVNFRAKYLNTPIFVSLEFYNPNPGTDRSDIMFRVKALKAGFFSVPAGLVNFILKDYNPLLNKSNAPIKLKFGRITAEDNFLTITDK
jgi:hypothetical protein